MNVTHKRIIVILLALTISATTIISVNVPNAEAKQKQQNSFLSTQELQLTKNKWYGNPCGFPITLSFNENHKYERTIKKQNELGTWEMDDNEVIMDKGCDNEMIFTLKDNILYSNVNNIDYIFSTDSDFAKNTEPEEINKQPTIDKFNGKWEVTKISSGELTAQPKILGIASAIFDILDGKMSISISGETLPKTLKKNDIELSLNEGVVNFHVSLVDNINGEGTICMYEDNTIKITMKSNNINVTLYAEKQKEDIGN